MVDPQSEEYGKGAPEVHLIDSKICTWEFNGFLVVFFSHLHLNKVPHICTRSRTRKTQKKNENEKFIAVISTYKKKVLREI